MAIRAHARVAIGRRQKEISDTRPEPDPPIITPALYPKSPIHWTSRTMKVSLLWDLVFLQMPTFGQTVPDLSNLVSFISLFVLSHYLLLPFNIEAEPFQLSIANIPNVWYLGQVLPVICSTLDPVKFWIDVGLVRISCGNMFSVSRVSTNLNSLS